MSNQDKSVQPNSSKQAQPDNKQGPSDQAKNLPREGGDADMNRQSGNRISDQNPRKGSEGDAGKRS